MRFETLNYTRDPLGRIRSTAITRRIRDLERISLDAPTTRRASSSRKSAEPEKRPALPAIGVSARGHNMLGSTRSGGRWPSMKVRMLMMTFSPMSTRPSSVAEPICGSSTTLPAGELQQLRVDRRLVLEHVEAGAGDLAGSRSAWPARPRR